MGLTRERLFRIHRTTPSGIVKQVGEQEPQVPAIARAKEVLRDRRHPSRRVEVLDDRGNVVWVGKRAGPA